MNAEQTINAIDDFENELRDQQSSLSDEEQENHMQSTFTKLELLDEQIAEKDEEIDYYNQVFRRKR